MAYSVITNITGNIGHITGYRDLTVILNDLDGYDGLGLDLSHGSDDDGYHVVNIHTKQGYFDSIAVNGAINDAHAVGLAKDYVLSIGIDVVKAEAVGFDTLYNAQTLQNFVNDDSQNVSYKPIITAERLNLAQAKLTSEPVLWDGLTLISHGGDVGNLLLDMMRHDGKHELTEPTTHDDLKSMLGDDVEHIGFDALVETKAKLEPLKNRLAKALQNASDDKLSVTDVSLSEPFSKQGKANVYFEFMLSDGQVFRIFFHNPDSSPKKLSPSDTMIAWKWTLNNKDVTAVIAPKQSETASIATLATNIMRLARENSKRFVATRAKRDKLQKAIDETTATLSQKTAYNDGLIADIDNLREQIKNATQAIDDKAKMTDKGDIENTPADDAPITLTGNELLDDEPTQETTPPKQELEYRPHGRDLTFVGQEFDHTPTGDTYTVWGVAKGEERWGVAILVETVNMGKKITTKELAQKVANAMQDEYGATQLEIRSDKEFLGGGISIKNAFGAGGLAQNQNNNVNHSNQITIDGNYYHIKVNDKQYLRATQNGNQWVVAHSDDGVLFGKTQRFKSLDELVQAYPIYQELPNLITQKQADEQQVKQESEHQELDSINYDQSKFTLTKQSDYWELRLKNDGFGDSLGGCLRQDGQDTDGTPIYTLFGLNLLDTKHIAGHIDEYATYYNNDEITEFAFGLQNAVDKLSEVLLGIHSLKSNQEQLSQKHNVYGQILRILQTQANDREYLDGDIFVSSHDDHASEYDKVLHGRTISFAKGLKALFDICQKHNYQIAVGDFNHTLSKGLFDAIGDDDNSVVVQIGQGDKIARCAIDDDGYITVLIGASGDKGFRAVKYHQNSSIASYIEQSLTESGMMAGENTTPEQPMQENQPMNEPTTQNPNYTQADIDYLQSIIDKAIDLETVDMDKMIEIGEKDENDPLYAQALQIVSDYLDEMSR